jgi:hypothetical protein
MILRFNWTATSCQHVLKQQATPHIVQHAPLAFHYANLMSHTAFRQSLACVSLLYQHATPSAGATPSALGFHLC